RDCADEARRARRVRKRADRHRLSPARQNPRLFPQPCRRPGRSGTDLRGNGRVERHYCRRPFMGRPSGAGDQIHPARPGTDRDPGSAGFHEPRAGGHDPRPRSVRGLTMRWRPVLLFGTVLAAGGFLLAVLSDAKPARAATADIEVTSVRVEKAARTLTLLDREGNAVRRYSGIQLGDEPVGPKHYEGDERTPEGRYVIDYGNENSSYFLSLHISYPAPADSAFAARAGRQEG